MTELARFIALQEAEREIAAGVALEVAVGSAARRHRVAEATIALLLARKLIECERSRTLLAEPSATIVRPRKGAQP